MIKVRCERPSARDREHGADLPGPAGAAAQRGARGAGSARPRSRGGCRGGARRARAGGAPADKADRAAAIEGHRRVRISVTHHGLPRIGLAGAPAAASASCWTFTIHRHPVRSPMRRPTPTCRSGTRRFNNDGTEAPVQRRMGRAAVSRVVVRPTRREWGSDALFSIENGKLTFHSYLAARAADVAGELCRTQRIAHPDSRQGRDGAGRWYQGGLSVFGWTDIDHPRRSRSTTAVSRRLAHGHGRLMVRLLITLSSSAPDRTRPRHLRLMPSGLITENELAAAKSVKMAYWNTQDQQKLVWAPTSRSRAPRSACALERTDHGQHDRRRRARWRRRSGARAHSAEPRDGAGHAVVWRGGFGSRPEEGRSAVSGGPRSANAQR